MAEKGRIEDIYIFVWLFFIRGGEGRKIRSRSLFAPPNWGDLKGREDFIY